MTKLRLAHLSDIHLTAPTLEWQWRDWFNKRLAAWFNFRWLGRRYRFRHADMVMAALTAEFRERRPDHIIFSGDATALGFESEFRRAAEALGVGNSAAPAGLAVPGNHDYCTIPAAASGQFERHFAPWQQGERVDAHVYPFAQKVGPAWLIAVNSCTGNRWAWDAAGSVGGEQLDRLERLLQRLEGGLRILVTHYPVALWNGKRERRTHGLRDLDKVLAVATRGKISLWLHGHRHGFYHLLPTAHVAFPILCAGSATQTRCWSYGAYVLDGTHLHVQRRVFDLASGAFIDGASFALDLPV
jgi:3',5'-cyclic AMP phosphodiesterase CpdA